MDIPSQYFVNQSMDEVQRLDGMVEKVHRRESAKAIVVMTAPVMGERAKGRTKHCVSLLYDNRTCIRKGGALEGRNVYRRQKAKAKRE